MRPIFIWKNHYRIVAWFILAFVSAGLFSCVEDKEDSTGLVTVRIIEDPDMISPFFSKTHISNQICSKIFLPLADFDPQTLELKPVLIKEIPEKQIVDSLEKYRIRLIPGITWADGTPMTVADIITTVKMLLNPFSEAASIRSTLENIVKIEPDTKDPLQFDVYFSGKYHIDLEAFLNLPIVPAKVFDSKSVHGKTPFVDWVSHPDSLASSPDSSVYRMAAEEFKATFISYKKLNGNGPYQVKDWSQGQSITLEKVKKWWGRKLDNPFLEAYPQTIKYVILPDERSAISALQNGQIDILPDISASKIAEISKLPFIRDSFTIGCPALLQYFYIALNNSSKILSDIYVRKALAHLVDKPGIIDALMQGKASRIDGPILPVKPYFDKKIPAIKFDPAESNRLLDSSGWVLSPGAKVRTKVIDGSVRKLKLDYYTTGTPLGRDLATLIRNEALKAGIDINIVTLEFSEILKKVKTGDYDMANMVSRQFPGLDDPYLSWHSENAFGKGTNVSNVTDPIVDSLVVEIRQAPGSKERNADYVAFQQRIHELQPVIFLFAPQNCIIVRSTLDPTFSVKRPGYFENEMK
jgi:ABC-type transport system substrate-binding protein